MTLLQLLNEASDDSTDLSGALLAQYPDEVVVALNCAVRYVAWTEGSPGDGPALHRQLSSALKFLKKEEADD